MLCHHIKTASANERLALVPRVERTELEVPPVLVFTVHCRGCSAVHSQEVALCDRPGAHESPVDEFFAWLAKELPPSAPSYKLAA